MSSVRASWVVARFRDRSRAERAAQRTRGELGVRARTIMTSPRVSAGLHGLRGLRPLLVRLHLLRPPARALVVARAPRSEMREAVLHLLRREGALECEASAR